MSLNLSAEVWIPQSLKYYPFCNEHKRVILCFVAALYYGMIDLILVVVYCFSSYIYNMSEFSVLGCLKFFHVTMSFMNVQIYRPLVGC